MNDSVGSTNYAVHANFSLDEFKILHVASSLDARDGGTTTAVVGLALAQKKIGANVTVLATYKKGVDEQIVNKLRRAGITVNFIGPALGALSWHPKISDEVNKEVRGCHVLHVHALWEEVQHQACVAARNNDVPYIVTPHGMLDPWSLSQGFWKKKVYMYLRLSKNLRKASCLHFTSEVERMLVKRLNLNAAEVVLPNGLDLDEFRNLPVRGEFRSRYQIPDHVPIVLYLGRLHPKKGCDILIKAFSRVVAESSRFGFRGPVLIVAGPDSDGYQSVLEKLVDDLNIKGSVMFVGPLFSREKLEAFVDADLFGLISHQENFGIAVIEALAAGCPVLLSDQVNIFDLVQENGLGEVVSTEVEAVADALIGWLSTRIGCEATRVRAKAVALQFDWLKIGAAWVAQYKKYSKGKYLEK